jgi:uncharacterized repeat protein (TIGR03803 family)
MKPIIRKVAVAMLCLIAVSPVRAQPVFTTLYNFTNLSSASPYTNVDGGYPEAPLVLAGNVLYGTAVYGGTNGSGTVFSINTDGTGFTALHDFAPTLGSSATNNDGATPRSSLLLSGGVLYGTTSLGGTNGTGTVFALNTDGTGFTTLHDFAALTGSYVNADGAEPYAALVLSGSILYGTTAGGGTNGSGTVFAVNVSGTGFTVVYTFTSSANETNSDGAHPESPLILSDNVLYGTAADGGLNGDGTVFSISTSGTNFTILHTFPFVPLYSPSTNTDGAYPEAGLALSDNILYGAANGGGYFGTGTVFAINTNGMGFTNFYNFPPIVAQSNNAGAFPQSVLTVTGNTIYGVTFNGGAAGIGAAFTMTTSGTNFTNLYNFMARSGPMSTNAGGSYPAGVILSGNTLYGTAEVGGGSGNGTIFALSLSSAPTLGISKANDDVVVSWPAFATNYTLQTSANLISTNWTAVSGIIGTRGVNNIMTNPVSGEDAFFRLSTRP